MSEHTEQTAFMEWCQRHGYQHPALTRIFAIPNGAKLPYRKNARGQRYSPEAMHLLAEGMKPGIPDPFLPVPRGPYHGLFMETKVKPNKPTPEQIEWLAFLEAQGYAAAVCYGCSGLVETVTWYLALEAPCPKS